MALLIGMMVAVGAYCMDPPTFEITPEGTTYKAIGAWVEYEGECDGTGAHSLYIGIDGGLTGVDDDDINGNKITLTGTADTPGSYTVSGGCTEHACSDSETLVIVEVDSLQYYPGHGSYASCPAQPGHMAVGKGVTYTFKAIPDPSPTWPANNPIWGGAASGSGTETKAVEFDTASSTTSDYKVVTAKCGTQNPVGVNVQVVDLSTLDIISRRTSTPTENYYAVKADEHYEIGGTFSFQLDLDDWTEPIDLKYELWDTDWWNDLFASGTGDTCSYTFASGDDGDVIIRYYIDTNGDGERDWGEPKHTSEEFWVQDVEEYEFDVEYSGRLGGQPDAQSSLTAAAHLALKKDSADDWRACVTLTVNSMAEFTSGADRPDPCTWNNESQCEKHYNQCDMTLLKELDGALGVCWSSSLEKILIDSDDAPTPTYIHEVGHGCGLADDTTSPADYIMVSNGSATRKYLTQTQADTMD